MKKGFKKYLAAWAVLLVVFSVLCFATPGELGGMTKYGGAFWSGYVLIMLAMVGQLACACFAFKAENKEQLFLNLPLITISYSALILSFVVGALCMLIPNLPNWVGVVLCALILGFNAISVIKASAAAELVAETDARTKAKESFIRTLTVDAENLLSCAKTEEAKAACKKVYEALRYSDPMRSDALADIETDIERKFAELSAQLSAGNDISAVADELLGLIANRNRRCRAYQ